jgi:hypothetical protein
MEKWDPTEITKYGYYINENKKLINTSDDINSFALACMQTPPYAYIAMLTIPVSLAPQIILNLYKAASIVPMSSDLLAGITLIASQATVLLGTQKEFFKVIAENIDKNPQAYAVSLLYLAATMCQPIEQEFVLSTSLRLACIQLYYTAINQLLLGDVEKAEKHLLHALAISSKCKESIPSILDYLGLVQFLNKKNFAVYKASVPDNLPVSKKIREMFDIDLKEYKVNKTLLPWEMHIRQERARRIIFDVACTFSKYKLEDLENRCQCPDFEGALAIVLSEINAEVKEGWIYFEEPTLNDHIEKQIESVQNELIGQLKTK